MSCSTSRASTGTGSGADLPRQASWRRPGGRRGASTRRLIRRRRGWRRRGGRCSSTRSPLLRQSSRSRRSATSPFRQPNIQLSRGHYCIGPRCQRWGRWGPRELSGYIEPWGIRTEAGLLVALRAAVPAVRAVRSADRANMLMFCWPVTRSGVDQWGLPAVVIVVMLSWRSQLLRGGLATNQGKDGCDWPTPHLPKMMIFAFRQMFDVVHLTSRVAEEVQDENL